MHEGAKLRQIVRCMKFIDDGPYLICKPPRSLVQSPLKFRTFLLEVCQDRPGSGERQRMSYKRSREESYADFGKRRIALWPLRTVHGIHAFRVACNQPARQSYADDHSLRSQLAVYV